MKKEVTSLFLIVILLLSACGVVVTVTATTNQPTRARQEAPYTVKVGRNTTFTTCNWHCATLGREGDVGHGVLPLCDGNKYIKGNTVGVSLSAPTGTAGYMQFFDGVHINYDLGNYTWEQVKDWPLRITFNFAYNIVVCWPGWPQGKFDNDIEDGVGTSPFKWVGPELYSWQDRVFSGNPAIWPFSSGEGSHSDSLSLPITTTTVFEGGGKAHPAPLTLDSANVYYCFQHPLEQVYCVGGAGYVYNWNATAPLTASAEVTVHSITIEFLPWTPTPSPSPTPQPTPTPTPARPTTLTANFLNPTLQLPLCPNNIKNMAKAGTPFNILGTLTTADGAALSGKTISVEGGSTTLTATTDDKGHYNVSITEAAGDYSYTAHFAGDASYAAATSNTVKVVVVPNVATAVVAQATPSTVCTNDQFSITGKVSTVDCGGLTDPVVNLQEMGPLGWKWINTAKNAQLGTFSFIVHAESAPGTYLYRVVYPGDPNYEASVSPEIAVQVIDCREKVKVEVSVPNPAPNSEYIQWTVHNNHTSDVRVAPMAKIYGPIPTPPGYALMGTTTADRYDDGTGIRATVLDGGLGWGVVHGSATFYSPRLEFMTPLVAYAQGDGSIIGASSGTLGTAQYWIEYNAQVSADGTMRGLLYDQWPHIAWMRTTPPSLLPSPPPSPRSTSTPAAAPVLSTYIAGVESYLKAVYARFHIRYV